MVEALEIAPSPEGSTFIEQLHNYSVGVCTAKNTPFGIGLAEANRSLVLSRFYCNQWDCPTCAARLSKKWLARCINGVNRLGGEWNFLTLTVGSDARGQKSTQTLRAGWRAFYTCVDALLSTRKIQAHYFKVWEQQGDGSFHIHAIIDTKFSARWTKDTAVYAGLGHQAQWEKVRDAGQCAAYVAKYSVKNLEKTIAGVQWPKGLRRIETSRNWPKLDSLREKSTLEWVLAYSRDEQLRKAQIYYNRGFQITDKVKEENE